LSHTSSTIRQQIRFCEAHDGVQLAWAKSGEGPPLVKAANWITHLEHDVGSPVWGHLLHTLSQRHTLLRYDQRGSGLSDREVARQSFDDWVRDLEAVVDAAGLESFPLLGMGAGAAIAATYAARHPGRVTHLVLHGGFAQGRARRGSGARLHEEAEAMIMLAELGWSRENPAFRQFFATQFMPDGTPEQHRWFNTLQQQATTPANAARMMRATDDIDLAGLLPRIACPTLVLHAAADGRVPFEQGRLLAAGIPNARFVPLDSRNHLPLESEPAWRQWRDEVDAFLPDAAPAAFCGLTPGERDLLDLLATGRDNSQIAAMLALREKTIRNRVTSLYAKLEVESRAQAIVLAQQAGFGKRPAAALA
jgi:pimeloyl-ACP methyl ester carboxylesterase/DNA-binding CsgD family transcriptional regulator